MKKTENVMKDKRRLFFALLIYKLIIEVIYLNVISPTYTYYGLITNWDFFRLVLSLVYFIVFFFSIPKKTNFASTSIYIMIGIFMYIPTISYYWMSSQSHLFVLIYVFCFLIMSLILKIKRKKIVDKLIFFKTIIFSILILYILTALAIVIIQGGIDPRAFDFKSIYELRQEIDLPRVLDYILNWNVKVFTPFFFAYFFYKRDKIFMMIPLVIQLLLYLTFGYKAYLFSIGFLVLCLFINKFNNFNVYFTHFYTLLNVVSTFFYTSFGNNTLLETVPFRMVFVPVQAQHQYYEFFSINPKVYYADGLIGALFSIESPYNESIFHVISNAFYGRTFGQNAGIFGDAYGNGGFVAMIGSAILLGGILYLIDCVTTNIPKIVTVSAFSYIIFVFNDNSILTSLLTGGIGLLILLFYFFNSEIEYSLNELHTKQLTDLQVNSFSNKTIDIRT